MSILAVDMGGTNIKAGLIRGGAHRESDRPAHDREGLELPVDVPTAAIGRIARAVSSPSSCAAPRTWWPRNCPPRQKCCVK